MISDPHRATRTLVCGLSSLTEAQRARMEGLERKGKMEVEKVEKTCKRRQMGALERTQKNLETRTELMARGCWGSGLSLCKSGV